MDVLAIATPVGAVASVASAVPDGASGQGAPPAGPGRCSATVENVRDALWALGEVAVHADVQPPADADVGAAMQRFEREWQRSEYQVPPEARHLGRSVREAMANCFGAPAVAGVDPRAQGYLLMVPTASGGASATAGWSTLRLSSRGGSSTTAAELST